MRKGIRAFLACAMAVGMVFTSACDLLNVGNTSSSNLGGDSSISGQDTREYKFVVSQPWYSMLEEEVVQLKVRLFIDDVESELEGVTFTSANPNIATVDDQGRVTAIKAGKTVNMEKQAMEKLKKLGADMGLEDFLE